MKRESTSPAMQLLGLVWREQGHKLGRSSRRLNDAMSCALGLAIGCGMRFDRGNFEKISDTYSMSHWYNTEAAYRIACGQTHEGGNHGPNMSAATAIEHFLGRRPFIIGDDHDRPPRRIFVGRRFKWYGLSVDCTSFASDNSHLVACAYRMTGGRSRIARRFAITHEDLRNQRTCLKHGARLRQRYAALSPAQRQEIDTWGRKRFGEKRTWPLLSKQDLELFAAKLDELQDGKGNVARGKVTT